VGRRDGVVPAAGAGSPEAFLDAEPAITSPEHVAALPLLEVVRALSDAVRWEILRTLAQRDSVPLTELEQALRATKPTIAYHLRTLAQAGVIEIHRRGRNTSYSLRGPALRQLGDSLDALADASSVRPQEGANDTGDGRRHHALPTW
jgi:DNA-binding transcriptional ArsR family regulator